MSYYVKHPKLGPVKYTYRRNSRSFRAYWADGIVNVSVPAFASPAQITAALDGMTDRLLAGKPTPKTLFVEGEQQMGIFTIVIERSKECPSDRFILTADDRRLHFKVAMDVDLTQHNIIDTLRDAIYQVAQNLGGAFLGECLKTTATALGIAVPQFRLSRGVKVVGRCSSQGVISLSRVLLLLPDEVREYVICHELAHLKSFDHSPEFHRLCDSYCRRRIGKSERTLEAALRDALRKLPI